MRQINEDATCNSCPYYHHVEDDDVMKDGTVNMPAHGYCQRYPHWEWKSPGTAACGEHPNYFAEAKAEPTIGERLGEYKKQKDDTGTKSSEIVWQDGKWRRGMHGSVISHDELRILNLEP